MRCRLVTVLCLALLGFAVAVPRASADEKEAARLKREAQTLLRKIGETRDATRRAPLEARFDALDIHGRVPALVEGLYKDEPALQRFAIARLAALGFREIAPHFVMVATSSAPREVRDDAHAGAVALDAPSARLWYEHVMLCDLGRRRTLAMERLAEIKSPESVPPLAMVMATVTLEVHAAVAKLTAFDNVWVNLGALAGGVGTNMPIQLPTVSLMDVHTGVQVPVPVLTAWGNGARSALTTIVGADLGPSPDVWRAWYDEHKGASARPDGK